jgi:tetratricopeptide (TPR) repeat protein
MLGFATLALGLAQMYLGDFATGFSTMRTVLQQIKQLPDESILAGTAMGFYALGLTEHCAPPIHTEAEELAQACMARVPATAPAAAVARVALARVLLHKGELAEAEEHARRAMDILRVEPVGCLLAHAQLVRVLLHGQRVAEARAVAESGQALLDSLDGDMSTEIDLRLAVAEAREASGDPAGAREALAAALHKLRLAVARIPDAAARHRYLSALPIHVRVRELARLWLGELLD